MVAGRGRSRASMPLHPAGNAWHAPRSAQASRGAVRGTCRAAERRPMQCARTAFWRNSPRRSAGARNFPDSERDPCAPARLRRISATPRRSGGRPNSAPGSHESAGRAVALACDRRGDPALAEFMARLDSAAPACTCSSCRRGRPRRTTPPKGSRGAGRPAQDQGRTALAGRRGGVLRDVAAQDGPGDARPADARLSRGCTDPPAPRRAAPRRAAQGRPHPATPARP